MLKSEPLLRVEGLDKAYRSGGGLLGRGGRVMHAAKSVEFVVRRGETLGLVGESGSGKTTVARCVVRLIEADGGRILLDGTDLLALSKRDAPGASGCRWSSRTRSARSTRA